MIHNINYAGQLVSLIIPIIFVLIVVAVKLKKGIISGSDVFDERQELIRGKAFMYGFFTLLIYFLFYGVREDITGQHWGMAGVSLGICLALAVILIICIWNDAYVGRHSTLKFWIVFITYLTITNLYRGIPALLHRSDDIGYFFEGVLDFLVLVVIAVKSFKDRQEKNMESL